jgi:aldose 1-epimerase
VVTGYHTLDEYFNSGEIYFGALIGRYGNRIGGAVFSLDGKNTALLPIMAPIIFTEVPGGFHNVIWDAEMTGPIHWSFPILSPHMEEGYPGNLSMKWFTHLPMIMNLL